MTSRKNTAGAAVQAQPLRPPAAKTSDWPSAWQAMHVCLVVIEGRLVTLAEVCGKKPDRKARQFDVECAVELALAHIRRMRADPPDSHQAFEQQWHLASCAIELADGAYRFPRSRYGRLLKRTRWHFDLLRDLVERVEWQHRRG